MLQIEEDGYILNLCRALDDDIASSCEGVDKTWNSSLCLYSASKVSKTMHRYAKNDEQCSFYLLWGFPDACRDDKPKLLLCIHSVSALS